MYQVFYDLALSLLKFLSFITKCIKVITTSQGIVIWASPSGKSMYNPGVESNKMYNAIKGRIVVIIRIMEDR